MTRKQMPSDTELMKLKTIDLRDNLSSDDGDNCFQSMGPEDDDDDDDKISYR